MIVPLSHLFFLSIYICIYRERFLCVYIYTHIDFSLERFGLKGFRCISKNPKDLPLQARRQELRTVPKVTALGWSLLTWIRLQTLGIRV